MIPKVFGVFAAVFFLGAFPAHAATTTPITAMPVIAEAAQFSNATSSLEKDGTLTTSFTIQNGATIPRDIVYGLSFTKKPSVQGEPTLPAYSTPRSEAVHLAPNEKRTFSLVTPIPVFLSGDYQVYVVVADALSGKMTMMGYTGTFTFVQGSPYALDSCLLGKEKLDAKTVLTIPGDQKTLDDIQCTISRKGKGDSSNLALVVSLSQAGTLSKEIASSTSAVSFGSAVSVAHTVTLNNNVAPPPGRYIVTVSLFDTANNSELVRPITGNLFVDGTFATIDDLAIAKNPDEKGGVSALITVSGNKLQGTSVVAQLKDGASVCGKVTEPWAPGGAQVSIPVSTGCTWHTLTAEVVGKDGAVLATRSLEVNNGPTPSTFSMLAYFGILLIVLAVLGVAYLKFKGKGPRGGKPFLFLLVFAFGITVFAVPHQAFAQSCSISGTVNWSPCYDTPGPWSAVDGGTATAYNVAPGYSGWAQYQCHAGTFDTFLGSVCTPNAPAPPTSSVAISPNPVPSGGNPGFTLYSTNAMYCQVLLDGATYIVNGYVTSGTYYYGSINTVGSHYVASQCWDSAWTASGWTYNYFTVSPTATGIMSASPSVCVVPTGGSTCSSTITWSSSNASNPSLYVNGTLFAQGASGSQAATWIVAGTVYNFSLYDRPGGIWLAGGPVTGETGSISASPNPCTLSSVGGTCASTITWSSTGAYSPNVAITTSNSGKVLVIPNNNLGSGASGSVSYPAITNPYPDGSTYYNFVLYNGPATYIMNGQVVSGYMDPSSVTLTSVTVTGVPPPPTSSVSVSPSPVSYGGTPGFTLSSTNGYYCYLIIDNATTLVAGYTTSGTFYNGAYTTPGSHYAQSYCYNQAWVGSGWSTTYFTVNQPIPTIDNITISSGTVNPNNSTQYTIAIAGSNASGAASIYNSYALINYQGENGGAYRGYLTYYPADAWPGYQDHRTCSGSGGYAVVQPGYGNTYVHLDSCSVSDAGNTRTVSFVVRFDPTFTTPVVDNDISGYLCNNVGQCVGWINFQTNFNLIFTPTIDNVTINSGSVLADAATPYTITDTASNPSGGSAITDELALINYQGVNAGTYRGYLGWSLSSTFPFFGGSYKAAPIACTGGGSGAIYGAAYGPSYLNLVSCSTAVVGNTRTASFVVTFNPSFTTPTTNNTISGYVYNNSSLAAGWIPYGIFGLAATAALTLTPTSCVIASGAGTCTVSATWTTNAATAPALVDTNVGQYPPAKSTLANQGAPGLTVWIADPQTRFELRDGATVLDTKTATASCAAGSTWNGSICAGNSCAATTISNCSLPLTASGGSAGNCSSGYTGSCNYTCSSGAWSRNSNSCIPVPIATLSATPGTIDNGQSSTLTWGSTNAVSCGAAGGALWLPAGSPFSGNVSVSPSVTSYYQVTCIGPGGSGSSSVVPVTVLQPTVTIGSSPDRVPSGATTTVSWNATNINSCTITKNGATPAWQTLIAGADHTLSGSAVDTITGQMTYRMSCTNNAGPLTSPATKIVNTTQGYQEF